MSKTIYYTAAQDFSPRALEVLRAAKQVVYGDEEVEWVQQDEPSAHTINFGTKSKVGIRSLSPAQILFAPHALSLLCDTLSLYQIGDTNTADMHFEVITDLHDFSALSGQFCFPIAVDIETSGDIKKSTHFDVDILSIAWTYGEDVVTVCSREVCQDSEQLKRVVAWLAKHYFVIGANFKFDQRVLFAKTGIKVPLYFDTFLAHHAQNQGAVGFHSLKDIAQYHLGAPEWEQDKAKYTKGGAYYENIPPNILYEYNAWDVYWTYRVWQMLERRFDENTRLAFEHEMRMSHFYLDVELNGFAVDLPYVKQFDTELGNEITERSKNLSINPSSPKQVIEYLHALDISTETSDSDFLETIVNDPFAGKFAQDMLAHRAAKQGKSHFTENILRFSRDGIVHPEINVSGTKTGRLSAKKPNIQNQPRETRYRQMWTTRKPGENVILSVDYAQAEARVMAALAGDNWLRDKLMADEDFFDAMLPEMFPRTNFDMLNAKDRKELRTTLKSVIYGLSFGRGAKASGIALGMSTGEAQAIINRFLSNAQGLAQWRKDVAEAVVNPAKRSMLVNPFGRVFQAEIVHSGNYKALERSALSFLPQSTASDICVSAAMTLHKAVPDYNALIVATIHDSIIIDVPLASVEHVAALTVATMIEAGRQIFGDYIMFKADWEYGPSWGIVTKASKK